MKKKLLVLSLAIITLLSGCGKSNGENAGNQNQMNRNHSSAADSKEQGSAESDSKEQGGVKSESKEQGSVEAEKYEQPEMKGEITISTMIEQEFLKAAAEEFEKKYPDITITINTYQGASGENMANDYRTLLNTKIMSGKAEDIIFSTQLPVKKYMDMGVFEDLSDYISKTPEMNEENYFLNVLEAAKDEEGQLFIMPYMSSFQVISFDREVAEEGSVNIAGTESISFSEAVEYAMQMTDNTLLKNVYIMQGKGVNYFENLVKDHQDSLIHMNEKKVNIDTEQYVGWLEEVKEIEQKGYLDTKRSIDYYNDNYHFAFNIDYDVQAAFYNLDGSNIMGRSIADETGNVYTNSAYCFGLNSASNNKEIAWEFMKYLLSEEVQGSPSIHGLPVHKKGFEASADRYFKFYMDGSKSSVEFEEYQSLLLKWVKEINSCDVFDPNIMNYINEENSKFFDGTQSAEKTAQILQSKITQYLNE